MSAHITSKKEDIAKIVLMAGDPFRVKNFVEKHLIDYKLVNNVRNEYGYTGMLNGKRVSVFSHGMGLDSIGIYAYELFDQYDVEHIIRFGSAGSYTNDLELFDVVIAEEAFTDSNYGLAYDNKSNYAKPDAKLLKIAKEQGEIIKNKVSNNIVSSTIHSSQWFYTKPNFFNIKEFNKKGISAVEMEAYALYTIANYLGKSALTLLTISDHLVKNNSISVKEREGSFDTMFTLLNEIVSKI